MIFEVYVTNIGCVCETDSEETAKKAFNAYAQLSTESCGRAAGETVSLLEDYDIVDEFTGALQAGESI